MFSDKKKNVKYAASIFHKINKDEIWIRKQNTHTAQERLKLRPLFVKYELTNYKDKNEQVLLWEFLRNFRYFLIIQ